jgi:glutamate racemase
VGDERPIGMFDSGLGGLTVARAVIDLLPDEHLVYLGDTGRYPYGPRPQPEVAAFAHQISRRLVDEQLHGAYQRAFAAADRDGAPLELTCAACPGFVEFVERGEVRSDQVTVLAERLLAPVVSAGVDTLLLGCTHYPFLARTISDVVGRDVVLVSSADETAFEVAGLLSASGVGRRADGRPAVHRFLSSGPIDAFRDLGQALLGPEVTAVEHLAWPA